MTTYDTAPDNFSDIIDMVGDRHMIHEADIVGEASRDDQVNLVAIDMPVWKKGRSAPSLDPVQERLALCVSYLATSIYIGLQGAGLAAPEAQKMVEIKLQCFTLKHAGEIRRGSQNAEERERFQVDSNRMFQGVPRADIAKVAGPGLHTVAVISQAIREAKRFAADKRSVMAAILRWAGKFARILGLKKREWQLGLPEVTMVAFTSGVDCISIWPNLKKYDLLLGTASALHAWTVDQIAKLSVAQYYCLFRCAASIDASDDSPVGMTVNYLALLAHHHLDISTFEQRARSDLRLVGLLDPPPASQRDLLARTALLDVPPIGLEPESPLMH